MSGEMSESEIDAPPPNALSSSRAWTAASMTSTSSPARKRASRVFSNGTSPGTKLSVIRSVSTRFVMRTASTTIVSFAGRAFSRQREAPKNGDREKRSAHSTLDATAHAAQVAERIAGELRVDDGRRRRKVRRRVVMVDDDRLDAQRRGKLDLRPIGDAAVHGDQQADLGGHGPLDHAPGEPVGFFPFGKHPVDLGSHLLQGFEQEHRRGDAVHVPVPEDEDLLAAVDRRVDPLHGVGHRRHEERVVEQAEVVLEEEPDCFGRR